MLNFQNFNNIQQQNFNNSFTHIFLVSYNVFPISFRPLCRHSGSSTALDLTAGNLPLYRQESSRLSEDDILKHLSDLNRQDKVSKLVAIPATLQLVLDMYTNRDKMEGLCISFTLLSSCLFLWHDSWRVEIKVLH